VGYELGCVVDCIEGVYWGVDVVGGDVMGVFY